jgi:hypothetical protein
MRWPRLAGVAGVAERAAGPGHGIFQDVVGAGVVGPAGGGRGQVAQAARRAALVVAGCRGRVVEARSHRELVAQLNLALLGGAGTGPAAHVARGAVADAEDAILLGQPRQGSCERLARRGPIVNRVGGVGAIVLLHHQAAVFQHQESVGVFASHESQEGLELGLAPAQAGRGGSGPGVAADGREVQRRGLRCHPRAERQQAQQSQASEER